MPSQRSLSYSLPITLGAFLRELLAIVLVLILGQRAWAYDYFSSGLVLFLILMTMRVPYINSFAFLFEAISMGDWLEMHRVGLQRHRAPAQNFVHVAAVLAAHVGGAFAAAALRVYLDAVYGQEISRTPPPALGVSISELAALDPLWGTEARLSRLRWYGNDTLVSELPLSAQDDLGIGRFALTAWYAGEDAAFVFLLCVCFVHIWLASGVGEAESRPVNNPFVREYWARLFRACVLLSAVYLSLFRAFPTAHGSLHVTIFRCQYQAWNPSMQLVDLDNGEPLARIVGGIVGMLLAHVYNRVAISTERVDDGDESGDFVFRMFWGFEPDPAHTRAGRVGRREESPRRVLVLPRGMTTPEKCVHVRSYSAVPTDCRPR